MAIVLAVPDAPRASVTRNIAFPVATRLMKSVSMFLSAAQTGFRAACASAGAANALADCWSANRTIPSGPTGGRAGLLFASSRPSGDTAHDRDPGYLSKTCPNSPEAGAKQHPRRREIVSTDATPRRHQVVHLEPFSFRAKEQGADTTSARSTAASSKKASVQYQPIGSRLGDCGIIDLAPAGRERGVDAVAGCYPFVPPFSLRKLTDGRTPRASRPVRVGSAIAAIWWRSQVATSPHGWGLCPNKSPRARLMVERRVGTDIAHGLDAEAAEKTHQRPEHCRRRACFRL
jgi:hypothetical protein